MQGRKQAMRYGERRCKRGGRWMTLDNRGECLNPPLWFNPAYIPAHSAWLTHLVAAHNLLLTTLVLYLSLSLSSPKPIPTSP